MAKRKVFVSFDFDNDRKYKYLLEAWDANPNFEFEFNDTTSHEIKSKDVGRVKAALTARINNARYTLVIIGSEANKRHKDADQIGLKNWINFEIHQSKLNKNRLVGVKIDQSYESPDELIGAEASWARSFKEDVILKALNDS
jgi:hypothetical protein